MNKKLQQRLDKARKFPKNTCAASRHAQMLGETLSSGKQLTDDREHCGESILATVAALYEARTEIQRLKDALFFWLPNIPAVENECTERMANDAALLIGHDGLIDDSAEQRGWITLTPNEQASGGGVQPLPLQAPVGREED